MSLSVIQVSPVVAVMLTVFLCCRHGIDLIKLYCTVAVPDTTFQIQQQKKNTNDRKFVSPNQREVPEIWISIDWMLFQGEHWILTLLLIHFQRWKFLFKSFDEQKTIAHLRTHKIFLLVLKGQITWICVTVTPGIKTRFHDSKSNLRIGICPFDPWSFFNVEDNKQ